MGTTLAAYAQEFYTWVLTYLNEGEGVYVHRCRDADVNDASLIHPTEVTRWDCEDDEEDYTVLDAVETECGCPSPAPTAPATPSTSAESCPEGGSFYVRVIWDDYDDLGTMNGCYEDSGHENFDAPEYFRGGQKADDQPVVAVSEDSDDQVSKGVKLFSLDVRSTLRLKKMKPKINLELCYGISELIELDWSTTVDS